MKTSSAALVAGESSEVTGLFRIAGDGTPVEALFRNTVEQAPVGIAFANRDGTFRHCNRAFCSMLGFDAAELNNRSIANLTHAEDLESTTASLERLWGGELTHLDVEKRYVRKDGSALWVRVSTSLVHGGGAEAECSVEFLRDISARKEMAEALLQNQTLLAAVIAELPLALLACDVTGRVTHYNRAAVELFGIPAENTAAQARSAYPVTSRVYQLDGTTPVPPEDRPLACALRGEEVSDAEFIVVTPQGAVRTALSSARRLVGPAGQALGAVAVVQDITDRKHNEAEIKRYIAQLERAMYSTIDVIATISGMRDPYTHGHENRVAAISAAIAEEMGLEPSRIEGIRIAGYLHDLGKILVPAEILAKPTRLTPEEFNLVKLHPQASYEILKPLQFPWPLAEIARQHHERLDGSGYPQGLKDQQILLEAKILAVADTVEAMASHRPYRAGLGLEASLAEIEAGRGKLFEPLAVDACLRLFRQKGYQLPTPSTPGDQPNWARSIGVSSRRTGNESPRVVGDRG
jgi:PAS domain S-box-containing protein